MIKISIIALVYNTSKYLRKCLDSLINQDVKNVNYEIIVVNDGSTDNSEEIILEYQKKYSDIIKYIKKKNGGPSSARNEGLKHIKGEFVLFVDSDDYVDETLLSTFMNNSNHCDLFVYGYTDVYEDNLNSPQVNFIKENRVFNPKESLNFFFEKKAVRGYVWNKIFKADIILKNKLLFDDNVSYIEDLLFVVKYLSKCKTIYFSSELLYNYLQRSGSLINSNFNIKKLSSISAYEQITNIVEKINSNYLPTIYYFIFELNYELSVRLKVSKHFGEFNKEYILLKNNMGKAFHKFIFKNVSLKYKFRAIVKFLFYGITLLKHGGKNAKN